ncbi:MAG: acyl carrier protein [Treponema sp.]|uniref:acyl carrier protein n=1 Tax=Treponema sp. TaxID=166 RepID=UPI0025E1F1B4|nr:acyl carrier protein [Treponema sp.]MBQ8679433.1 acyl carrier protein [Treponema sp.]
MDKNELYSKIKEVLVNDFDIDEALITPQASIEEDLELDSIDSVEMIVKIKPFLNSKIEPAAFKSVKTVQDVVDILEPLTK